MKNWKEFLAAHKKGFVITGCVLAAVAVLGTLTTFAANTVAKGSSIGEENAQNFAFADAGVDPLKAQGVHTEFDYEQGQFVYDVEFFADGTEYDYWIKASDGSVVKKNVEIINAGGSDTGITAGEMAGAGATTESAAAPQQIDLEKAKEIALADAGLGADQVTFIKEKLDRDDGISVYEIEFYADTVEYEYEINVGTGEIRSKSIETLEHPWKETPEESLAAGNGNMPLAGSTAGEIAGAGTVTEPADKEVTVPAGTGQNSAVPEQTAAPQQIDLEKAKEIALADAGVSAADAVFTKTKQDYEDRVLVYEIDFYTASGEYDYEIDASNGNVRSREIEPFAAGVNPGAGGVSSSQNGGGEGSGNPQNTSSYIDVEQAKSIALGHAGLDAANVIFSKAKLDHDDGYTVYEIEFYGNGMEYEYTINAITGDILEYDSEWDDDLEGHHHDEDEHH